MHLMNRTLKYMKPTLKNYRDNCLMTVGMRTGQQKKHYGYRKFELH